MSQVLSFVNDLTQGLLLLQYESVPRPTAIDRHPQIGSTICRNNRMCYNIIIISLTARKHWIQFLYPSVIEKSLPFCPCIAIRYTNGALLSLNPNTHIKSYWCTNFIVLLPSLCFLCGFILSVRFHRFIFQWSKSKFHLRVGRFPATSMYVLVTSIYEYYLLSTCR